MVFLLILTILIVIIVAISVVISILLLNRNGFKKKNMEIALVVARYNEDLEWLRDEPFNKYYTIIYNKGVNDNFYKPINSKIINLENIGRCDQTYLYHIIKNYKNLANVTIFLPGSINLPHKINKAKKTVKMADKTRKTCIYYDGYFKEGVANKYYDFQLAHWSSSDPKNKEIISNTSGSGSGSGSSSGSGSELTLADIRPFGKWYDAHFKNIKAKHVVYYGIFAISKETIKNNSKKYYEDLIKEFKNSSNPEVGHYFERSWFAVFKIGNDGNNKNTILLNSQKH